MALVDTKALELGPEVLDDHGIGQRPRMLGLDRAILDPLLHDRDRGTQHRVVEAMALRAQAAANRSSMNG